jgi:membrane protein DedA with SNARE-associated domain
MASLPLACLPVLSALEKVVPVPPSCILLLPFGLVTVQEDPGDLASITLAATLGSVVGAICWYTVGRLVGGARCERIVHRHGKYLLLPPDRYRRLAAAYSRHHFRVAAVSQTLPTACIHLALPAGAVGLAVLPFLAATWLGTMVWNAPLITLGYLLRDTGWSLATTGLAFTAIMVAIEAAVVVMVARARR